MAGRAKDNEDMEMRTGITCSAFDLLHAGHILMLEDAKRQCDHLIVGLQVDPQLDRPEKERPIQTILEREIQLAAVKHVDQVIIYETEADLLVILKTLPIDVRILGEEYKEGVSFTGEGLEIELYFNQRKHGFSTQELKQRIRAL